MYVGMCICTHACALVHSCAVAYSGGQSIKCASCFFPSAMWELGITLKSSGLVAIAFAHWVTSVTPPYFLSKWMNKNNLSINQCRIKSLWGPGVLCEWTSTHFILLSKVGPGCNALSTNTQHVLPYPRKRLNGREAHSVEGEWTGIVSSSRTGCAHGSDWWRGLKLGQAATDSPNSISQEPRFQVMILCETFHIQAIAHF